jgi:pimeloyl-ACP methyl ester carboxylesterase
MPRDGAAVARDLDKALKAARISGPFVLAGHSAGGLYIRLFAARRRDQVKGMVFVDTSVEHQERRLSAVAGPGAGSLAGLRARAVSCLRAAEAGAAAPRTIESARCFAADGTIAPPSVWRTQISELDTLWGATSDQVDRIGDLLRDVPIVVLTAGKVDSADAPSEPGPWLWWNLHRELAERSTSSILRQVASSHMMMSDRPEVVVGAIEGLVLNARTQAKVLSR